MLDEKKLLRIELLCKGMIYTVYQREKVIKMSEVM